MDKFEITMNDLIEFEDGKHFNKVNVLTGKYKFIRDIDNQDLDIPAHIGDVYDLENRIHFHYFDRDLDLNHTISASLTDFGCSQNCTQIDPFLYERDIEWIEFLYSKYGEKYAKASKPLIQKELETSKTYLNHINKTLPKAHQWNPKLNCSFGSKQYYEKELEKCQHSISVYSDILSHTPQSSEQTSEDTMSM